MEYKDEKLFDSDFGFTIDVIPDSNCGLFRRYHVGNNPVNFTDPWGLYHCEYSISAHRMICVPDNPVNPYFDSNEYLSGNNRIPGCQNNAACQNEPFIGPIPEGFYDIGPIAPGTQHTRGLTPDPTNGRDDFMIHGCGWNEHETCSTGCIAATTNATRDRLNELLDLEGHNTLLVVP